MIYLDHTASTSIWDEVLEVLIKSSIEDYANPSSSHGFGREILKKIEIARNTLIGLTGGVGKYDLFFTSSATESNNMVIKGIDFNEGDQVSFSCADHPSLVNPSLFLEKRGIEVKNIPLQNYGRIDKDLLIDSITGNLRLLVLSHVNNQSGNIYDVLSIATEIKNKVEGVHIHVDGVQGFGKLPLDLSEGVVDSYSVSSHKIGGPKGVAALFIKKGKRLNPILDGGGQENGMRPSTRPAPLILAFSEAAKYVFEKRDKGVKHVKKMNEIVTELISKSIPESIFPFTGDDISPYILNLIVPGISSDIVVRHLEREKIYISTTSACSSGHKGENKVFSALTIPIRYHNNVYRISFSTKTTKDEVVEFAKVFVSLYKELKELN